MPQPMNAAKQISEKNAPQPELAQLVVGRRFNLQ
jgi:hypothetical protein